jgi:hypothetical protein
MDGTDPDERGEKKRPAALRRLRAETRELLLLVPPVAVGIGLLALVAAALGFGLAGHGAFWFELGKTALNVIAVALVGGITARGLPQARERPRPRALKGQRVAPLSPRLADARLDE